MMCATPRVRLRLCHGSSRRCPTPQRMRMVMKKKLKQAKKEKIPEYTTEVNIEESKAHLIELVTAEKLNSEVWPHLQWQGAGQAECHLVLCACRSFGLPRRRLRQCSKPHTTRS